MGSDRMLHKTKVNDPLQSPVEPTRSRDSDDAYLATLGYKQELKRDFTPWELFGIAFSVIGLFPSITYAVMAFAVPNGGPFAMVWGWAICGFFLMCIGMALAELGSAAPTSGGLYYWTHTFASPRYKNLLSWVVGYSNTISLIAGVAGVDWGCAQQLMAAASIGSDLTFTPTNAQTFGAYVAVVVVHGIISSAAAKYIARLQTIYVILNVLLCLVVIIAVPAATPNEFKNSAKIVFTSTGFQNLSGWPNGFAFILSFLTPLWTVAGFDSPVHISEEASNARVAVPWAIVGSTGVAVVLGWGIMLALAFNMGTDTASIMSSQYGQPMAQILFNSFGKNGVLAIWAAIIVVQFMMGMSTLTVSSRQIFAFSRDGALPLSGFLRRVNKYTHTPIYAVWFSVTIALLCGLLAFAGSAAISAIFTMGIAAQYLSFVVPISCRWLGQNNFRRGPFYLGIFSLPVSAIAALWMTFQLVVFMFPTDPNPTAATMNYSTVVWGGVLVFSLVYFYLPKYGGIYWFTGPVSTLEDSDSFRSDVYADERDSSIEKVRS
ncbi:amino acid/polyamine transporter I [Gloeopeniophorella convolvens]|nr:amino acid/polyamine transporter I [Gloeopeniophorella convolvens]